MAQRYNRGDAGSGKDRHRAGHLARRGAGGDLKLFVYGTLMRGEPNARHLQRAVFVGAARTAPGYTLALVGPYPALLPGGSTAVSGEVYDVDEPTLRALDLFEGDGYRRGAVTLAGHDGPAEAYFLVGAAGDGAPILAGGDWRRRS